MVSLAKKLRSTPISLSLEEFAQTCNLPSINQDYNQNDNDGGELNFDLHA